MRLDADLHIHTHCSCDSACALLKDVLEGGKAAGMKHIGISDHLHTRFNLPDIVIARKEFLEQGPVPGFHFGLEISCATQWECDKIARRDYTSCFTVELQGIPFRTMTPIDGVMYGGPAGGPLCIDISDEEIKALGIEYLIGGVHKPNYTDQSPKPMIDDYFDQMQFLIRHKRVDILAHPWWALPSWSGWSIVTHESKNEDVYWMIPQEYWDELGKLLVQEKKLAEINSGWLLGSGGVSEKALHFLMEHYANWREMGVKFSHGTDLHGAKYRGDWVLAMNALLKEYGFTEADFDLPRNLK